METKMTQRSQNNLTSGLGGVVTLTQDLDYGLDWNFQFNTS